MFYTVIHSSIYIPTLSTYINITMDYSKVIAIEVDIDIDYGILRQEFISIVDSQWNHHSSYLSGYNHVTYKSLFLTKNDFGVFDDFKIAKTIPHSEWYWDDDINMPYTKKVINSLPAKAIGIVRIMVTNGILPLHTDCNSTTPTDYTYSLGLSISPVHSDKLQIGSTFIPYKALFFNDSIPHGFLSSSDIQMSIRIFGDFEYDKFNIKRIHA